MLFDTYTMNNINKIFYQLIRVAIGTQDDLSYIPKAKEWQRLYDIAKKQSLVGVCFAGVQRLVDSEKEDYCGMSELQYLTWMGMAAKIQQRNEVVNRQCAELQARLSADGFPNYIMKGQAVGSLYKLRTESGELRDLSALRQSGDIDVYLEGELEKILAYAKSIGKTDGVNELEMHVDVFPDTEVEFHYRPMVLRDPFKNRRLQQYFDENAAVQFENSVLLDKEKGLQIKAPTNAFNLVHQLVHIYLHFITGGVGLRQLMDYYFVLRTVSESFMVLDGSKNATMQAKVQRGLEVIHEIGLDRFAGGLSWVLNHVFALPQEYSYWEMNENDGRVLLEEIMISGNFGHTDERMADIATNRWTSFWFINGKTFRFRRFDHWAWFWSPVWRIYHFIWRKAKGFS